MDRLGSLYYLWWYELRIYPTTQEHPPYTHAGVLIHKYRYMMYTQQATLFIRTYIFIVIHA